MLKGKTALITGSTLGLGYAIAEKLAAAGCNIVLNGIEGPEVVTEKVSALEKQFGVGVLFDGANVGDAAAVETMVNRAVERFGSVDIVVNNAVTRVFGLIEDTDPADWDRAMSVNLSSAFNTLRCALPGMKKNNWGRIVNMSSIYGLIGAGNRASYVVSKTALIGLTRAVAAEVLNYDIACNAVCPGSVNTTHSGKVIQDAMAKDGITEEAAIGRFLAGKQPTGRFIALESVSDLVFYLCTMPRADVNGATFPIDMAWSAT